MSAGADGESAGKCVIGLALGGGFARGITHIGVLRVFERNSVPVHRIAGVSAGAMIAAAYASGTSLDELEEIAGRMRLSDVAGLMISRVAVASTDRMTKFLMRLLKRYVFEEMQIPLCAIATDLDRVDPVVFRERGDVLIPIRASCAYPGLFHPVRHEGRYLVDGAFSMEIPAAPLRQMNATRVIGVHVDGKNSPAAAKNIFQVVSRCSRILHSRTETQWRRDCDLVIEPDVTCADWNSFSRAQNLIAAGEAAATAALPIIREWLKDEG
jgi:NTE family protein